MIDDFSMRARQLLFAARLRAGERGTNQIEVEDILLGLILEHQGMLAERLWSKRNEGSANPITQAPSHIPLLSREEGQN
jgi:hypothetical protein